MHPLRHKLPLPLMAAISALPPLAIDMYLPAIPGMAESYGTEISTVQYSLSVFLVSFGFGMMLFGPLSDRYGRRPLAVFGMLGFAAFSLALALSPTAEIFLILRVFQGFLGSAATITIPAMIRDCFGKDTAKGMSTVTMIMLTAPLVSPLIGSAFLTWFDWHSIFFLLAIYAAIVLMLIIWKLPETLAAESLQNRQPVLNSYKVILGTPVIYPYLATFLMSSMAFFTYLTSVPFIYITWFGVSATKFGFLFTTNAGALILANFINVRVVSRIGPRRMMHLGLGIGSFFALCLLLATLLGLGLYWTVVCFFMIVGCLGIISVNAESLVLIRFPNQASTASAVARTLRFSTGALVGPILALIYTGTPVPIAGLILGSLCAAIAIQPLIKPEPETRE
jgi:DHA1 family bicyclomycin/chloramphenicol resistance-like MFS transporter